MATPARQPRGMTNQRNAVPLRRDTAALTAAALHARYVRAINAALHDGQENIAEELASAYASDSAAPGRHRINARVSR
jgi:hypothetical protein